ncbi:TonB-dependent siderophore receptor [Methylosinus sp. LW3]|uniref:TonB-dependent siderophore receptor n=1 Tax=Methylosinus sp. LW3 TaxID=107635 RepID=UPI000467770D|nr:TonB-dependent siderophore receptor [Methylosinus sp. LW3]
MPRFDQSRGLSAAALAAALAGAPAALAQETLPTIDIGADRSARGAAGPAVTQTTAGPVIGYKALTSVSATRTSTPIADTPATINVVTRQQIEDTASFALRDALEYTPGVTPGQGFGGGIDEFWIRGFDTFWVLRDGMPIDVNRAGSYRDMANVERVEVLKGPTGMLYGRQDPGGSINLVMKEPLATPSYSLKQTFASYDKYRTEVDVTGPALAGGAVTYRFNGAFETSGSFRDFVNARRVFLAPVVVVRPSEDTKVKFELEYTHARTAMDWGIPSVDPGIPGVKSAPANVPRSRFFGEPGDRSYSDEILLGASLEHRFSDSVKMRAAFDWQTGLSGFDSMWPLGLDASQNSLSRFQSAQRDRNTYALFGTVSVEAKASTGPLEHTFLVGYDRNHFSASGPYFSACCPPIDLHAPAYGNKFAYGVPFFQDLMTDWWGVFAQDQIRLTGVGVPGEIFLTPGVRFDRAGSAFNTTRAGAVRNPNDVYNSYTSWRVGLLWRPAPDFSVFANYADGLAGPNYGKDINGETFKPEIAKQAEFGARFDTLGGLLSSTLSIFEIKRRNIATINPVDPSFVIATGEVTHRGVELENVGKLSDTVNIVTSYTFIDSKITRDNDAAILGKRYRNVSDVNGSVLVTKAMDEWIPGLTIGAGVVAKSEAYADLQNKVKLPAYARVDLLAKYKFTIDAIAWEAQLNIKNLLDTTYYPHSDSAAGITVGAPISVFGSLRATF